MYVICPTARPRPCIADAHACVLTRAKIIELTRLSPRSAHSTHVVQHRAGNGSAWTGVFEKNMLRFWLYICVKGIFIVERNGRGSSRLSICTTSNPKFSY